MMTLCEMDMVRRYLDGRAEQTRRDPKTYPAVDRESVHAVRRSDREFDLWVACRTVEGASSVWLPMGLIGQTDWASPAIAAMTDHPGLAREGDWNGVSGTSQEKLWAIFERFVCPPAGDADAAVVVTDKG